MLNFDNFFQFLSWAVSGRRRGFYQVWGMRGLNEIENMKKIASFFVLGLGRIGLVVVTVGKPQMVKNL